MTFSVKKENTAQVYDMLCEWWKAKKFPSYPLELLPETTFVCYIGDTPIYSVCQYLTDSKIVWLAWPLTNSDVPLFEKQGGLEYLFSEAEKSSKEQGFKLAFTTSGTAAVIDALLLNDYVVGDEQINHYWKHIF